MWLDRRQISRKQTLRKRRTYFGNTTIGRGSSKPKSLKTKWYLLLAKMILIYLYVINVQNSNNHQQNYGESQETAPIIPQTTFNSELQETMNSIPSTANEKSSPAILLGAVDHANIDLVYAVSNHHWKTAIQVSVNVGVYKNDEALLCHIIACGLGGRNSMEVLYVKGWDEDIVNPFINHADHQHETTLFACANDIIHSQSTD
eukprot:993351_1